MKKLLLLGLLSMAGIGMSARDAKAWYPGCWWHDRCCNKCTSTLCIKQYNAFSPVAYGSIVADGCMPINMFGGCAQRPMASCFQQGPSYGPGFCASGCCDVGCLPAPGSFASAPMAGGQQMMPGQPVQQMVPTQPLPQINPGQQFQAPSPQVINPSLYMMPTQQNYGYVQPVGYYPNYQPMYNPYYYPMAPMNYYAPVQAPNYWYGR